MELLKSIEDQKAILERGTSFVELKEAATLKKGILAISSEKQKELIEKFDQKQLEIAKFVPASGAASRMFKVFHDLKRPLSDKAVEIFNSLAQLPFFEELNKKCLELKSESAVSLVAKDQFEDIADVILSSKGLNFGSLPKGLIPFHKYDSGVRNPFQEQFAEADVLFENKPKSILHFTVPPDYLDALKTKLDNEFSDSNIKIELSVQDEKTNTISLRENGEVLNNETGDIVTRPGGHGALVHNLNSINADVIFIKNIDNVVGEKDLQIQVYWKKVLAGVLLELEEQIHKFQLEFSNQVLNEKVCREFFQKNFHLKGSIEIEKLLFRPIRVCGMVKNEGQPGGGPFFIEKSGEVSLQIVESAEIDTSNPEQAEILRKASHFNPVDIVCGVRDFTGKKYNLLDSVDSESYFVAEKTKNGIPLKVLELPGLWNGAMFNWNTVFIEVPAHTFNPVKTVNDLINR